MDFAAMLAETTRKYETRAVSKLVSEISGYQVLVVERMAAAVGERYGADAAKMIEDMIDDLDEATVKATLARYPDAFEEEDDPAESAQMWPQFKKRNGILEPQFHVPKEDVDLFFSGLKAAPDAA